jgi:hypothetical protein
VQQRFSILICIATFYLAGHFLLNRWTFDLYYGDPNGYYLHVVSFFVNQDVGDYDKTITSLRDINPTSADPREDKYGIRLTEKGRRYIKYTLGVPVMETPFFLMAHAYASWSHEYAANGWTRPYLLAVSLSVIVYVLVGFYLLMGVLERYFSKRATALVVLSIALATNLFFHAAYTTMAHGFLFFDYCLLIFLSDRFYQKPEWSKALLLGGVVGLITLTRIPEIVSAFIPFLWGVSNWKSFKGRVQFWMDHYPWLLLACLGFTAVFSIQIIYWYYVSGHLVFNPYQGEGFNFLEPKIHKGWFDFANGWLVYTPIMGLALIGLFSLSSYRTGLLWPILAFFLPHIWIHYSYYVWTYFPGLGQRPMVETYPALAFGLGAFFVVCYRKKWLNWVPVTALWLFAVLNLFQTWQMKEGLIWTERGNHAFYWETFGRTQSSLNALRAFDSKVMQPDSSSISFEKNILIEHFEDPTDYTLSEEYFFNGSHSLLPEGDTTWIKRGHPLPDDIDGGWLGFSSQVFVRPEDKIWNRDQCMHMAVEIFNEQRRKRKGGHIFLSPYIGNQDFSIWTTGKVNQWGQASFFMKMPHIVREGWTMDIYLINPYGQKIFLDELRVEHFEKQ